MFVVDTNVLVYASDVASPGHDRCRAQLERWRHDAAAWYVTWPIVYEFLRVVTHPRVLRAPLTLADAWSFVDGLFASPGLGVLVATARHATVAAELTRSIPHLGGNIMHDAHTAVLMREHGVKQIVTRDTDFHRFPFLTPVDPLA